MPSTAGISRRIIQRICTHTEVGLVSTLDSFPAKHHSSEGVGPFHAATEILWQAERRLADARNWTKVKKGPEKTVCFTLLPSAAVDERSGHFLTRRNEDHRWGELDFVSLSDFNGFKCDLGRPLVGLIDSGVLAGFGIRINSWTRALQSSIRQTICPQPQSLAIPIYRSFDRLLVWVRSVSVLSPFSRGKWYGHLSVLSIGALK